MNAHARILVVDDEPDFRAMMRFNLEAEGHAVVEAGDGAAALAALATGADVVVLDAQLSGESGLDVLAAIRRRHPWQTVVLLTSGMGDHDERARTANARLRKPFELDELRSTLAPLIEAALTRQHVASVLVVDDEPDLREMLSFNLRQEGYLVETAASGEAAVEALWRRKFDLCITDLKMPGMGGVATVEALRKLDPDLDILVVTGYATVETAVACMKAGAYDYLCKPYDIADLLRHMGRALERRQLHSAAALYEATQDLLASPPGRDLGQVALSRARTLFGADAVGIVLRDESAGAASSVRWAGADGDGEVGARSLLDGLERLAEERRVPMRFPDDADPAAIAPYEHALLYPLLVDQRFLGALVVLRAPVRAPFSRGDLHRGAVYASQLAMALYGADLFRSLENTIQQLVSTREQLMRTEKLSVAGTLAGAVAHEINNPLAVVISNLGALDALVDGARDGWSATAAADAADILVDAKASARRIADLVTEFRTLGGTDVAGPPETIDVGALVDEMVLSARTDPSLVDVTLRAEGTTSSGLLATAAAGDLRRAFGGLLESAAERAAARDEAAPSPIVLRCEERDGRVRIVLEDPHTNLAPEEREHLFDPRVSVDARGGRRMRLRLGMSVAEQLVRRNGGTIDVFAGTSGGTFFALQLRATTAPA